MASVHETTKQREALKQAYPNAAWAKKVNLMPADQVTAVFLRLRSQKKI